MKTITTETLRSMPAKAVRELTAMNTSNGADVEEAFRQWLIKWGVLTPEELDAATFGEWIDFQAAFTGALQAAALPKATGSP